MKWFTIFLVLFLLLPLGSLSGLSEEERAALPEMSKETLIIIIETYDMGLTDLEKDLEKLEVLIQDSAISIGQLETELEIQEILYQRSLELQKELKRANLIDRIVVGVICTLAGLTAGYIITM